MLTGQSHVSQGLTVQVPDSGAGKNFSANESRHSELLLSSHKGPGASCAGQTACAPSLIQSSAGRSVSLPEQGLLTQISGLEYSQSGPGGRVLADCEVSSASTMTLLAQDHAAENQDAGSRTTRLSWHKRMLDYPLPKKKRNERKNLEKALTVTPKEDSPRVLSSRVAGLSAETTRHTPDMQADAGASRVASGHPVTFSDETGGGAHLLPGMPAVSSRQQAVLRRAYESGQWTSREKQERLAGICSLELKQVTEWFSYWHNQNNECEHSSEKGDEAKNAGKALPVMTKGDSPRVLSSRAACSSIAGSSAETTRHTPGLQADASASRIERGRFVRGTFRPTQLLVLKTFYTSKSYPSSEEKRQLAERTGLAYKQVASWFAKQRYRGGGKACEKNNAGKALRVTTKGDSPRTLSSRAACSSITGLPAGMTSHTPDTQADASASRITNGDRDPFVTCFRRDRHAFSKDQLAALNAFHEKNSHPSSEKKRQLAEHIGLTYKQVTSWFSTRNYWGRTDTSSDKTRAGCKSRCRKIWFSKQECAELKTLYNRTEGYPSSEEKDDLANKWGVEKRRILAWFQNERIKKKGIWMKLKNLNDDKDATGFQMIAGLVVCENDLPYVRYAS